MKKATVTVLLSLLVLAASATHNMASDISYTHMGSNTFKITVRTFTNTDPNTTQADRCEIVIYFGDGDSAMAPRINGPASLCATADGQPIATFIKKNIYEVTHTYPGYGMYTISIEDPNRVAGICNIPNSVDVSFWFGAEIILSAYSLNSSSPQYTGIPMIVDTVGIVSYYTPAFTDAGGDSLSYELVTPMSNGTPVTGYTPPANSTDFSINPVTGLVTWNTPTTICNYVYAIKIKKWRTINGASYNIGTTMQEVWNQGIPFTALTELNQPLVKVYPNPSNGLFTLEFKNYQNASVTVLNMFGEKVLEEKATSLKSTLDLSNQPAGMYWCELKSSEGIKNIKLVVQ
jgi:hypothetical protein